MAGPPLPAQKDRSGATNDAGRAASTMAPGLVTIQSGVAYPSVRQIEGQRQTILMLLCAGSAFIVGAVELVFSHAATGAINLGAAALQFLLLEIHRRNPRRLSFLSHACLLIALANITACTAWNGSVVAPSALYLAGIPLLAVLLLGTRPALFWSAASIFAIPVALLGMSGRPVVVRGSTEMLAHLGMYVLASIATALATRRSSASQVGALEQRERTIQRLLKELSIRNSELAIARDSAMAASRAKGDFLAVMSHEMRTPLNAVIGLTGLLLDTPLSPEQRELLSTVKGSGAALLTVINDILDFSKIESGKMELSDEPFDVATTAEEALEILGQAAANKGLDLACVVSPDLPAMVRGDATRVRQIFLNLISNAIKFTPSGSVEVTLDVEASDEQGILIRAAVHDTGVGIQRDQLDSLFQPFSQLETAMTRRSGGTGLGLAICRKLAETMGGRAWAESEPGKGSVFQFTFRGAVVEPKPAVQPASGTALVITGRKATSRALHAQLLALGKSVESFATVAEAAQKTGLAQPDVVIVDSSVAPSELGTLKAAAHPELLIVLSSSPSDRNEAWKRWPSVRFVPIPVLRAALYRALRLSVPPESMVSPIRAHTAKRSLRILLAEDNEVNQLVVRGILQRGGHDVTVVDTGVAAVAEVSRSEYDVVLMDMRMPEMDGVTAARHIRKIPGKERSPSILALTANATKEDKDVCLAAGMNGFLTKPVVREELEAALLAAATQIPSGASAS